MTMKFRLTSHGFDSVQIDRTSSSGARERRTVKTEMLEDVLLTMTIGEEVTSITDARTLPAKPYEFSARAWFVANG